MNLSTAFEDTNYHKYCNNEFQSTLIICAFQTFNIY